MVSVFHADDQATPITPEERNALIPTHVTLRSELNELEQQNIIDAEQWAFARKRRLLSESFLRRLHRRMFNRVWRWAGRYRTSEKNIGVAPYLIEVQIREFLDDAHYWIEHNAYAADEIAVRVHHRLVSIHPFPNGNGRWSRLVADLLIVSLGSARFTWGQQNLHAAGDVRERYIDALHAADSHDIRPLLAFARS